MKNRVGILSAILAIAFLAGSALPARALDTACQRRIVKAQKKLDKAIHKHGYQSAQAERRRQQLAEARASCQ